MNKIKNISAILIITLLSACSQNAPLLNIVQKAPNVNVSSESNDFSSVSSALKKASAGLFMISESDYPFKGFSWKGQAATTLNKSNILKLAGKTANTPVEETTLDKFFSVATEDQTWHSPEEKENVKKFRNLVKVIKVNLKNVKVFRVGTVTIDVYIVGSADKDLVGLSTKLVETRK